MRRSVQLARGGAFLLGLSGIASAKQDPLYNPSQNFRPANVTGLSALYAWVGSYYNVTTTIELNPSMGADINESLCENLQGYTARKEFNSILSITERGLYNNGSNPVNLWLTLLPPGMNLSAFPAAEDGYDTIQYDFPFLYYALSSTPKWKRRENTSVIDNFDLTASPRNQSAYRLEAVIEHTNRDQDYSMQRVNVTMPGCNSSTDTDDWAMTVFDSPWWSTEGWDDFILPRLDVQFDDKIVNGSIFGDFDAYVFVNSNRSIMSTPTLGTSVQGTVNITFSGVLDGFHSDLLVMDMGSKSPRWLRTVGFGNDSQDIGYGSGANQRSSSMPWVTVLGLAIILALL